MEDIKMEAPDTSNVEVTEEKEHKLSEAQIHGINSSVISLISRLKQYTILTALQMELSKGPHQIQPIMREIYRFEETKLVTSVREAFDMFYVYANHDKIVMNNISTIREKFEQALAFITHHMQKVDSAMDKNYMEVLDSFADMLSMLIKNIQAKPIFDEGFKID